MNTKLLRAIALPAWFLTAFAFAEGETGGAPATQDALGDTRTGAPAAAPGPTDEQKAEAKTHFDKGLSLFEEEAWDAALAEFVQSRAVYPTRAATKNAAICLRKLHRFDEAVDMFETFLRDFPNLPADERTVADTQIKELSGFVGTIAVVGVEPGAKVVIDGRDRGETPAPPFRVSAGTHVLRVSKEGFASFESQVTIAGSKVMTASVQLEPLLQGGRLHVEEASGQAVDVLVDGATVGKTPWDGMLPAGTHVVALRGAGNLGTQPLLVNVVLNGSTPLQLRAESLSATLRIQPSPAGATLILDGVPIGHGAWRGRVRQGSHALEVRAEGFVTEQRRVVASPDAETAIDVPLRAVGEDRPGRVFLEVDGAFAISPSFGGELTGSCSGTCTRNKPTGFQVLGHVGYQLPSSLALLLDAGYLSLTAKLHDRSVLLYPQNLTENRGTADDSLTLSGFMVGPSAEFHYGQRWPLVARLGVGVMFGRMKDERSGSASTNERTNMATGEVYRAKPYSFSVSESPPARYVYLAPELRAGVRVADRFEMTLGLRAIVLVSVSQPQWTDETAVFPGVEYNVGPMTFGHQSLATDVIFVVAPTIGGRFDL